VNTRRPRIFIGLEEIADYYAPLRAGLEDLGYDAVLVTLKRHPFYGMVSGGRVPGVARIAMAAAHRDACSGGRPSMLRLWWWLSARFLRVPLLIWAIARCEIFVFGFASTFFLYLELPLLKLFRRRVVYIFHGSDSRPPYLNGAVSGPDAWKDPDTLVRSTRRTQRKLRLIDRWADVVVDNPLSAHLHEPPIVSFQAIGTPRVPPPNIARGRRDVLRVLHSPSHRYAKGSDTIRSAIENLRARGLSIELVELSGVPHDRVIEALAETDLVVDQLYSDVALAGFAGEAAAAGLPVIVAGYGRDEIEEALCGRPFPPIVFCRPDNLEANLERLAADEELRRELGVSARDFVERELSPRSVAQRLIDAIGGVRPEWTFDPKRITYVHGCGLTESAARTLVHATIERGGVAALCVGDKPALEARLIEFASVEPNHAGMGSTEGVTSGRGHP
jgi:glycosyltransferase involved in cell wall biosynthesis